ncbi:MAG: outer membrane lipoprotein-sorting protein [Deltaproteobacteria bacterium]|nr:outer membrane lipoprotein-sorting protein [Deltaproteobacteria bacterium]
MKMGKVAGVFLAIFLVILPPIIPARASAVTSRDILERVDDLWRGKSSYAEMSMNVVTVHWKRSLKIKAWSLGKDYSLLTITYPPKEKGIATLRAGKEIWNYLPRVNRVIKVPTSMMMAGWMGSHFTNDDLVKESRMSDDYDSRITFKGEREEVPVYEITLIPKPDAPVVWGKILVTVRQDELIPVTSLYYDEDGNLARTMTFSDVMRLGGRNLPATMALTPADKPGERTVIHYSVLKFGLGLKKNFFSIRNLSRRDLSQ